MELWGQGSLNWSRLAPAAEASILDIHLAALQYTHEDPITTRDRADIHRFLDWHDAEVSVAQLSDKHGRS